MNNIVLKILVGLVALALACCAAFFSIVGLSKLFAGATIAVIFMATTLEASKLVIASFLYKTWSNINKILRVYLIAAISIIAIITSIGIYGFLSGAYQNTKSKYELSKTSSDSLSIQKSYYEAALISYKSQLESKNNQLQSISLIRSSQEQRSLALVNSNKSFNSVDKSASKSEKKIVELDNDIKRLNDSIIKFSSEVLKLKSLANQSNIQNEVSSELGSLTYISRVTNIDMDVIVNILIILFMIVFDPLAICMVLAFNYLNETKTITQVDNTSVDNININESKNSDNWNNLTGKELADIIDNMLALESQSEPDAIPSEPPLDHATEDSNIPKPIEEIIVENPNNLSRVGRKQQELQKNVSGVINY